MVEFLERWGLLDDFDLPDGLPEPVGDDDDGIPDDGDDHDDDGIIELMGDATDDAIAVIDTVLDDLDGISWYNAATMSLIYDAYPRSPPTQEYASAIEEFEDLFLRLLELVIFDDDEPRIDIDDVPTYRERRAEYSKQFTRILGDSLTPILPFSAVLPDYPIRPMDRRDC